MKKTILIIVISLFIGSFAFAQFIPPLLWDLVSGQVRPLVDTWSIYSPDDLIFMDEIKPDGDLCANTQILQKTGADDWDCVAYTAGHGNGANCGAGEYALGVDGSGAVENCTDATTEINTEIGNVLDGTDAFTDFNGVDIIDSDNYAAGSIDYEHLADDVISGAVAVGTFTSGDTFLCLEAGVGLRECDYDDLPAGGAGDVTAVGDCASGLCLDGTSDGGTNITFYNIDSNKTQLIASDIASDLVITLPVASMTIKDWEINSGTIHTDNYVENPFGAAIDTGEITADTITHANIADADQMDTKCIWFEDPTADDDFISIWRNGTGNSFLITEIWGESDQTVNFDLVEGAGDCGDPVIPAAGEDENTGLSCTISASEEIDLKVNSVTNTPTWVSICWTGNWVD